MDLRKRTTHLLAATGALLIVGSLSLSGGVAVAVPSPAADDDQATTSSSRPKSSKQNKKKSTSTTEQTGSTRPSRSPGSTATTATTVTTVTTAPPTTVTTSPRRTTGTMAPTTATTAAPAETAPQQVDPTTEPSDDTSTSDPGGEPPAPDSPTGKGPISRSGSGLPPGVYPVGPGARLNSSTPSATTAPAPATTAVPGPPPTVAPAETPPTREGSATVSEEGVSDPVTDSLLDPGVSGTGLDRAESPAPVRRSRELGETGDGTRRLVLVGGVALLLGALVVAFTGRERSAVKAPALPAGPAVRRPRRPRPELDGWEDGVPLAPAKRELARHRLGISAGGLRDDEPGA